MTKEHIFFLHIPSYVCDVSWWKKDRPVGIKKLCYFGMMFSFDGCCCL